MRIQFHGDSLTIVDSETDIELIDTTGMALEAFLTVSNIYDVVTFAKDECGEPLCHLINSGHFEWRGYGGDHTVYELDSENSPAWLVFCTDGLLQAFGEAPRDIYIYA